MKATARSTGLVYFLMGATGAFNIMYISRAIIVRGDAAATARNIAANELAYRMMLWLLFKGAKVPLPETRPSYAS